MRPYDAREAHERNRMGSVGDETGSRLVESVWTGIPSRTARRAEERADAKALRLENARLKMELAAMKSAQSKAQT